MHTYSVADMKTLELHFTHMAERGWMIDKIGLFTQRYRAVEPCKKLFFVDSLPQITMFDYPGNGDAQDYRSICEESGWKFIAANRLFHVFCADGENSSPMPIHTDNALQAKVYLRAFRKNELPGLLFTLFMFWRVLSKGIGVDLFLYDVMLFMQTGCCILFIAFSWTLGFVFRWYMQMRKSSKNDLPAPTANYRLSKLRNRVFMIGGVACMIMGITLEIADGFPVALLLLLMLIPLLGVGTGLWIRWQIETKRRTRGENIELAIFFFVIVLLVVLGVASLLSHRMQDALFFSDTPDNRPALTLKGMGITETPDHSDTRINGSIAVPVNYEHWESHQLGRAVTHVYRSNSITLTHWLYDRFAEEFTKGFSTIGISKPEEMVLTPDDAAFWGAEKGLAQFFQDTDAAELLLLHDKSILRLTIEGEDMSLETVSQAVQKLWGDILELQ